LYWPMYYRDPYFWIIIVCLLISVAAQIRISAAFKKYSKMRTQKGFSGLQVATGILKTKGLYEIQIWQTKGKLTDHYDPKRNVVKLSEPVYGSSSIAACAVAAHEAAHVLQGADGYGPYRLRRALVPMTNLVSRLAFPLILLGIFMGYPALIQVGVVAYGVVLVFQLVTLPVEYNASSRALDELTAHGYVVSDEIHACRKMLNAAALTYVAAALVTLLQMLRLVLLANSRRR
jgi:Zn-dependent membrane protease YugP